MWSARRRRFLLRADFPVASVTSEGFVELCLRASNGGPAEEALCRLKPGDCLHISDAFGDFVIEGPVQTELHFIALGVGVVPIRPMLHAIAESEADPKFTLYHWAETSMDLIFAADFEALGRSCRNFEFTPMLGGSDILRTLLDERCSNTIGSGHEYFVAGAAEMLNMVREKLQSLGHDRERIHQQVLLDFESAESSHFSVEVDSLMGPWE